MANYPFRINFKSADGTKDMAWYTASLATDTDSQISASVMVDRINAIPSASYEDGVATPSATDANLFGGGRNLFISCSFTDPNAGAIDFNDTESSVGGGLEYYTFWGSKVCSVLGLPEGIPIYTENFKLSDDSNDPTNYVSGDIIADGLSVKESLKLSPQARVRSNLVWDEEFGEGLAQWVSGSSGRLLIGYDNVLDKYKITADSSVTFDIEGVDTITTTNVETSGNLYLNGGSGDTKVRGGNLYLLGGNRGSFDENENEAQMYFDTVGNITARGQFILRHDEASTWSNTLTISDYTMILKNRDGNVAGNFAGIAFDVGTTDNIDALSAAIIAERDNATSGLYDTNLSFATNDASDDGLTKRMTVHHDGFIEVISPNMISGTRGYFDGGESGTFSTDRYLDFNNGTQMTSTRGYRMSRPGSVTAVSMQFDVSSTTPGFSGPTTQVYSDVDIEVRKNGSPVFNTTLSNVSSTADQGKSLTQARGSTTFAADDIMQLYVNITNNGGYAGDVSAISLNDFCAVMELVFDE